MSEYAVCECAPVVDTLICCSPVRIPHGELEAVYLGTSGVFVIAREAPDIDLSAVRVFLRTFLGTARIEIYLRGTGIYSEAYDTPAAPLSAGELEKTVLEYTTAGFMQMWSVDMLYKKADKLRAEDGRNRGVYRDAEGNWFTAKGDNFVPLSDKNSNRVFRFLLFGGVLGAHRFALGKWFTGLLYAMTAGLFGMGWLMDLVQFRLGAAKDKQKRYLRKPDSLPLTSYLAGLAVNAALFCLYGIISGMASMIMQ